jgi:hypothetical protein
MLFSRCTKIYISCQPCPINCPLTSLMYLERYASTLAHVSTCKSLKAEGNYISHILHNLYASNGTKSIMGESNWTHFMNFENCVSSTLLDLLLNVVRLFYDSYIIGMMWQLYINCIMSNYVNYISNTKNYFLPLLQKDDKILNSNFASRNKISFIKNHFCHPYIWSTIAWNHIWVRNSISMTLVLLLSLKNYVAFKITNEFRIITIFFFLHVHTRGGRGDSN